MAARSNRVSMAPAATIGTPILNQVNGVLMRAKAETPKAFTTVNRARKPWMAAATASPPRLRALWPL